MGGREGMVKECYLKTRAQHTQLTFWRISELFRHGITDCVDLNVCVILAVEFLYVDKTVKTHTRHT